MPLETQSTKETDRTKRTTPQATGDHSDRQMLRYRRIRAERQEVLLDDTAPMLCRRGKKLLLCGRAGSLARSSNEGETWEHLKTLGDHGLAYGDVLALVDLPPASLVLAAIAQDNTITVLSSGDFGETWYPTSVIASPAAAETELVHFEATSDGSVLLRNGLLTFRSNDDGQTWIGDGESASSTRPETSIECDKILEQRRKVMLPDGRVILTYVESNFPFGARALISTDGGETWGSEVFVLGHARVATSTLQPRPLRCNPGVGAVSVVLEDGSLVSAYDRGSGISPSNKPNDGRRLDESAQKPAIVVIRWTPDGLQRPPLFYPNLWTHRVDPRGYLDNGFVRMRPDDRFEGGDFIEDYEMIVFRRRPAEQRFFGGMGSKGVVVCRHPDGSLIFSSRTRSIQRSTDEGLTWTTLAEVELQGNRPGLVAFGVTAQGTYLMGFHTFNPDSEPWPGTRKDMPYNLARSVDEGRTWTFQKIRPGPMSYGGGGDSNHITQLSDGTIVMGTGCAWNDPLRKTKDHPDYEGGNSDVMLRSNDDGKTWDDWTVLPPGCCESNFVELPSGDLLCATRYQRDGLNHDYFGPPTYSDESDAWPFPSRNLSGNSRYKNEAVMLSSDRGYNWTTPALVTRIHMCSADVVALPDGRVVMTYDHKDAAGGSRALVSPDGGRTWSNEPYILSYHNKDARTSSVLLQDGRILTLWAGNRDEGIYTTTWSPD